MADTLTTKYQFILPEVGASDDTWGDKLNLNLARIDAILGSVFAAPVPPNDTAGAATLVTPLTVVGSGSSNLILKDTAEVLPKGLFRLTSRSDGMRALANTAVAGDFSTEQGIWRFTSLGAAGFPNGVLSFDAPVNTFTIRANNPTIMFEETDFAEPLGAFRIIGSGGAFFLQKMLTAGWASVEQIWNYQPANGWIEFGKGLAFASAIMADMQDFSKHLRLHPSGYGIGVSSSRMNFGINSTASYDFYSQLVKLFTISSAGGGGTDDVTAQCYGHFMISSTAALCFGSIDNRFQRLSGGQWQFINASTVNARVELGGTTFPQVYSIATREKGDNRWALKAIMRDALNALPGGFTVGDLRAAILAALDAPIDMVNQEPTVLDTTLP